MHNTLIKRNFFAILLFYFFIINDCVYANGNFSGSVSFGYLENKSSTQSSTTTRDSFVQKYGIGYRGSLYSPKLLSYDLKTSLYLEDSEVDTNNIKSKSDSRGENYNINLNFIKDTFMPFSIYKGKSYTPYWSIIDGESSFADQEAENTGISGMLKLRYFDLTYSASESQSKKQDAISTSSLDRNDYSINLNKAFNDKRLNIQHSYNESDYALDSISSYTHNKERTENSRVNFDWDIKENLRLRTYSTYRNDRTFGVKSSTANLGMRWNPSKKYNASFNMNLNKIESPQSESDSIMFSENSSYIATPEITLNQDLLFFNTATNFGSYDIYSVGVGSSYRKSISESLSYNAGVHFNKRVQLNDLSDSNTSGRNNTSDMYSVNAGVTKKIEKIDSRITANASFSDQTSTLGDDNTRTSLGITLFTDLENNIKNNLAINYAKDIGLQFSGISDKPIKREIEMRTISDSLNYARRIGFNGRLSSNIGISQRDTTSISGEQDPIITSVTYPYASIGFTYRLWRAMVLNSKAKVSQDSASDLTNYTGFAGINYTYRKILMTIAANYLKQDDVDTTISEQKSINMLISRTF